MINNHVIVAIDEQNGIAKNGEIPWKIKEDMHYFKFVTSYVFDSNLKNAVLMGRKTWETLPFELPFRKNIVLSKKTVIDVNESDVRVCHSITDALMYAQKEKAFENLFIIGGERVYREITSEPLISLIDRFFITRIYRSFNCDQFFPEINFSKVLYNSGRYKQDDLEYEFFIYEK